MVKQILATVFLVVLLSLVVINITTDNEHNDNGEKLQEFNVSGKASQEGTGMIAPNAPNGLKVGEKAPNFTLETLNGETIQLSDLKGKKVFLNFWATWCPPCRVEMPDMERFYKKFGDEVEILAVNATGSEKKIEDVQSFIEKEEFTFPILLDRDLIINEKYQVISIPTTYFIGTDGIIQQPRKVGPMTYDFMIKMKDRLK